VRRLPIHHGATCPEDRRHALGLALVRVAAIAGFAVAGWIALSSMNQSAYAAQRDDADNGTGRAVQWNPVKDPVGTDGLSTLRHFRFEGGRPSSRTPGAVADDVQQVGRHPVSYLGERGHDAVHDGRHVVRTVDDTVHDTVKKTADATGVPHLRLPGVRPGSNGVGRLIHGVAAPRPASPHGGPMPKAHAPSRHDIAARGKTIARTQASRKAVRHADATASSGEHRTGGHCRMCGDGHRLPDTPVMPSDQDNNSRSGPPSGGHPFGPIADLGTALRPAAPPALASGAFHRTAPTGKAAPRRPSVVPD
jgi:hypothetical protein